MISQSIITRAKTTNVADHTSKKNN